MEKKLTKEERIREKEKVSEVVTAKMGIVFIALVAAIMALIRLGDTYNPMSNLLLYCQIGSAVLFAASIVWLVIGIKKGADNKKTVCSGPFFVGLSASLLFATVMFPVFDAFRVILSLIAFAVIFFVYEIYAFDFFLCTASMVVSCVCAAAVNYAGFGANARLFVTIAAIAVAVALCAVCETIVYKLNANGKLRIGKEVVKKPAGGTHPLVYVSIAAAALATVAIAFLGFTLYFIGAVCAIYFIVAIIYTIKLM